MYSTHIRLRYYVKSDINIKFESLEIPSKKTILEKLKEHLTSDELHDIEEFLLFTKWPKEIECSYFISKVPSEWTGYISIFNQEWVYK